MPSVKLYCREDQDFPYEADAPASILAYVNTGNSDTMGGGFGVFGAGYYGDWTVTYDEFNFVHSGHFRRCQTNLNQPAKGAGLRRSSRQLTPFGQSG